jgi:sulfatase modifying factor 1
MKKLGIVLSIAIFAIGVSSIKASLVTENMLAIGAAGNAADTTGFGAVSYQYKISKYEVTIGDFTPFYDNRASNGAIILTNNFASSYGYWNGSSAPRNLGTNAPVTYVNYNSAAQFCNWLTTGNATNGAYTIGSTGQVLSVLSHSAMAASTDKIYYVLPTEDEWYKAAYYTGSGYSLYANGTSKAPTQNVDANYGFSDGLSNPWAIGTGAFEQNGTFNMMGNVAEMLDDQQTTTRGGNYNNSATYISKSTTQAIGAVGSLTGFRVVSIGVIPEPATIGMLGLGGLLVLAVRKSLMR